MHLLFKGQCWQSRFPSAWTNGIPKPSDLRRSEKPLGHRTEPRHPLGGSLKSRGNNSVGRNSDTFSALPSCSLINWRNRLDSVASVSEATSGAPECVSMSEAGEDASFSDSTSPSDLPSEAVVQVDGSGRSSAVFQAAAAAAYALAHCSWLSASLFFTCSNSVSSNIATWIKAQVAGTPATWALIHVAMLLDTC